jgi:hypothetical protein
MDLDANEAVDVSRLKAELKDVKITNKELKNLVGGLKSEALKFKASKDREQSTEVLRLREAYEELEKETIQLRQLRMNPTTQIAQPADENSFVLLQLSTALEEERSRNELLRKRAELSAQTTSPSKSLLDQDSSDFMTQATSLSREALEIRLKADISKNQNLASFLLPKSRLLSGPLRDFFLFLAFQYFPDDPRILREILRECDNADMLAMVSNHLPLEVRLVLSRSDQWYSVVSEVVKETRAAFTRGLETTGAFDTLRDLFAMRRRPRNSFIEEYGILAGLAMDINDDEYQLNSFSLIPLTSLSDTRGERKAALKCAVGDCMALQVSRPTAISQQVLASLLLAFQQYN